MSEILFREADLSVSIYAGPERADGGSRKRFQLVTHDDPASGLLTLSSEQWEALRAWFSGDGLEASAPSRRPRTTGG